jgi:N-acetylglucosaminyl-diphospho-decaprenol L-rhamnosyltransferase
MIKEKGSEVPRLKTGPDSQISAENVGSSDDPRVSVVIVTYRSSTVITQCLESVAQAAARTPLEVVIVDNASPDNTVEVVKSTALDATIIERSHNGGFAVGCAAGADAAHGRWLLFLNPDAAIEADAIDALLDCAARHPDAGIIGGRFVPYDPSSWWGKPTVWSMFCFASGLNTILAGNRFFDPEVSRPWEPTNDDMRIVPIVTGAFMLVQRELWDQLGGFDHTFFMYGEDADFCMRAARAGRRSMVTAKAICRHVGGMSSSTTGKLILLYTGKTTLIRLHFRPGLRHLGVGLLLSGVWLRAIVSKRLGVASPSGRKRQTTSGQDWQELWAARSKWVGGWPRSNAQTG